MFETLDSFIKSFGFGWSRTRVPTRSSRQRWPLVHQDFVFSKNKIILFKVVGTLDDVHEKSQGAWIIRFFWNLLSTAAVEIGLAMEPQCGFESAAEVVWHETVDERVDAAVAVSQQVKGDSHVFLGTGTRTWQHIEAGQNVVDEIRRPTDGEQHHHRHQHLDHLSMKWFNFKCYRSGFPLMFATHLGFETWSAMKLTCLAVRWSLCPRDWHLLELVFDSAWLRKLLALLLDLLVSNDGITFQPV